MNIFYVVIFNERYSCHSLQCDEKCKVDCVMYILLCLDRDYLNIRSLDSSDRAIIEKVFCQV